MPASSLSAVDDMSLLHADSDDALCTSMFLLLSDERVCLRRILNPDLDELRQWSASPNMELTFNLKLDDVLRCQAVRPRSFFLG